MFLVMPQANKKVATGNGTNWDSGAVRPFLLKGEYGRRTSFNNP